MPGGVVPWCVAAVPQVTNISCYRFAPMEGLKELRGELQSSCKAWGLKGTILLSPEGINLFVAGDADPIGRLLDRLRRIPGLEDLAPKTSLSASQPFKRMLVRLKKEIIAFGVDAVRPAEHTSAKIAPTELKRWLDEGRELVLLDTRNDYEVRLGTFRGAVDPGIRTFRSFPDAVARLPESLKERTIVMFCTGGIRCEKAGPYMEMCGFKDVLQLDGGILRYFEECGSGHFDGDCFVFDQRVGVDPALRETSHLVCHACLAPLDDEDQRDPRFVAGVSCPHCHRSEPERLRERVAAREAALHDAANPLPGSQPYENRRPVRIPAALDGLPLVDALSRVFPQVDADEWRARCDVGRLVGADEIARAADHRVRAGEVLVQRFPAAAEPAVDARIGVLYEDEALIVVNKPAPLPVHPGGRYHRNTLQHLMNLACAPQVPRAVHRLDANTTGVVVFARTRHFANHIHRQFAAGTVSKTYRVRVLGHPADDRFACDARISGGPVAQGAREIDDDAGKPTSTRFRVLCRMADGTTLLEADPLTGRTHQIRLHLAHLGHPVAGDPCYGAGAASAALPTLAPGDPPMMLHAWRIVFVHPITGDEVSFEAPLPGWADSAGDAFLPVANRQPGGMLTT